jgi:thiol-disulfide isomerase/thioredoxin
MRSINQTKFVTILFFAALVSAQVTFAAPTQELPLPEPLKDELPYVGLATLDGNGTINNDSLLQLGKDKSRIAMVFWATWCVNCAEEVKILGQNKAALESNGVAVVLVNIGEREEVGAGQIFQWVQSRGVEHLPLGVDQFNNLVSSVFGLPVDSKQFVLPYTLLLDAQTLRPLKLFGSTGNDFPAVLWR